MDALSKCNICGKLYKKESHYGTLKCKTHTGKYILNSDSNYFYDYWTCCSEKEKKSKGCTPCDHDYLDIEPWVLKKSEDIQTYVAPTQIYSFDIETARNVTLNAVIHRAETPKHKIVIKMNDVLKKYHLIDDEEIEGLNDNEYISSYSYKIANGGITASKDRPLYFIIFRVELLSLGAE